MVAAFKAKGYDIYESPVIIEGGIDANVMEAYEDIQKSGINALVVFLGNFGPEGPETLIAQKFGGPVMYVRRPRKTSPFCPLTAATPTAACSTPATTSS